MKRLRNFINGFFTGPTRGEEDERVVTRLIRNVRGDHVNAVISDLEAEGFEIINVMPRMAQAKDGSFGTIYDILVCGDSDPTWGLYGQ